MKNLVAIFILIVMFGLIADVTYLSFVKLQGTELTVNLIGLAICAAFYVKSVIMYFRDVAAG